MRLRALVPTLVVAATLTACSSAEVVDGSSSAASTADSLWASSAKPLQIELRGGFARLFSESRATPSGQALPTARGSLVVNGKTVSVSFRRRGNTSSLPTECAFPKLKITIEPGQDLADTPFKGHEDLILNTHCGERPTDQRTDYGRVANQVSPMREQLAYDMVRALDVPTYQTRLAKIRYVDDDAKAAPLDRYGLFVEHAREALARFVRSNVIDEGSTFIEPTSESNPEGIDNPDLMDRGIGARAHLAEALLANVDFRLTMGGSGLPVPDRFTDSGPIFMAPLWNVDVYGKGGEGAKQLPVIQDFDLSGVVAPLSGRPPVMDPSKAFGKDAAIQTVFRGVQRTRMMFTRAELDDAVAHVMGRRAAVESAVATATVDEEGRKNAENLVRAFYDLLAPEKLYPDVVTSEDVSVLDPATGESDERCPATVPVGTPVAKLNTPPKTVGDKKLIEVRLFDVQSHLPCLYPPGATKQTPASTAWVSASITTGRDLPAR